MTVPLHCSVHISDRIYHFPNVLVMFLPWDHQLMCLHGLFYMHLFYSIHIDNCHTTYKKYKSLNHFPIPGQSQGAKEELYSKLQEEFRCPVQSMLPVT